MTRESPPRRRLRIAQVVTRMDVGGVPGHVMTLSRGLARDHDVTVVCGSLDPRCAEVLAKAGIAIERADFRRLPHPARDLRLLADLVGLFRSRRFDVVHTHMSKAALVGAVAGRIARTPAVVNTAHNLGFLALRNPVMRSGFWVYDRLLFAAAADRIVLVSDLVRRRVVAARLVAGRKAVAIPNGIEIDGLAADPAAAGRRASLAPEQGVLIVTVARLVWFKGLDTLVDAMASVRDRYPGTRLMIVGEGELRDALEAQAAALGLDRDIQFVGERDDVPALLAAADLFVLSSVSEGLPLSIIEAMAAGLSVVATAVGGVPELVSDGETGVLVPAGDPASLADALARLVGDPGLRSRMGALGRRKAESEFRSERMVARTAALYEEILDHRAGRPVHAARC